MNQNELKKTIQKYGETLHALRSTKSDTDSITEQKIAKMNNELDNIESKIKETNIIMQRPQMSHFTKNDIEEEKESKFKREYKNAFLKYIRKGVDTDLVNLLSNDNNTEIGKLLKSDSTGYAITPTMNEIISNNMFNQSPIRKNAKIVNVSRENLDIAAYTNEIITLWGDEREVAPETDAFSKKIIPVCDLTAQPKITQRMIDDSEIDHEAFIAELLSDAFSSQEDKAFLNGTGENQPKGILTYENGVGVNKIERIIDNDGNGKVSFEGLLKLEASLEGKYEKNGNSIFLTSKQVLAQIRSIKDGNGQYIWTPGAFLGIQDTLFGKPIYASSDFDTSNNDIVIYGNLRKGYQIVDRADIKIQRDPYSSKPFVIYYATKRVGGDVVDTNAIKVLKLS